MFFFICKKEMSLATFSGPCSDSRICVNLPTTLTWVNRKMKLVSMDFPNSQRTIEPGWSCLYYSEALRLTSEARTVTVLVTRTDGSEELLSASLPLTANRIVSVLRVKDRIEFTTAVSHGLFVGGKSILPTVCAILGPGTVPLLLVHSRDGVLSILPTDDLAYVSDFTVSLPSSRIRADIAKLGTRGYFVMPLVPTPTALCALLVESFSRNVNFSFDIGTGRTSVIGVPGCTVSSVGGDALAQWLLGFDGVFTAWEVAHLRPSCYSPGEFAMQLTFAMNICTVKAESAVLQYRDVAGRFHATRVMAGNYRSPGALAAAVHMLMEPNMPPDFAVLYDGVLVKFTCSTSFDLLFGGGESSWCSALGFSETDLIGLTEYSSHSCPHKPIIRGNTNTYSVCVEHDRLRVSCVPVEVVAEVESYRRFVLRVRIMSLSRVAIAHGASPGDVITICIHDKNEPYRRIVGVVVDGGCLTEADVMFIGVPYHGWNNRMRITLILPRVPFSICALPPNSCYPYFANTIGGQRVGLVAEVVYSVNCEIVAPYPVSLSHPTRVLVFLEDANGDAHSTEPEHVVDDRRIFTEVLVNERRVVPAVAHLRTEGCALQFRFANLDRSPYAFNDAILSFTIELV